MGVSIIVMGCDQTLREVSVNVISLITIWVKRDISELQISLFFMILSERLTNFSVISCENVEITQNYNS